MIEVMEEKGDLEAVLDLVEEGGTEILDEEEYGIYSDYLDLVMGSKDAKDHNANLVDHIDDDTWLSNLGQDVIEWYKQDLQTRKEWEMRERRGIRLLGVSSKTVGGGSFIGASKVTHPLLIEACTQFQARAIAEMWPSEGPVKAAVVGEVTDELMAQADRVQNYMNYQYMREMPGAFEEEDKMLFRLPISGSTFKKVVYDPMEGALVSRFIESSVFVVPYSATSLRTAIRFTEKYEESVNDTKKMIAAGVYSDFMVTENTYGNNEHTGIQDEIDDTEGREDSTYEGDHTSTRYECYCYLDVPGFEDKDMDKKITGISLPYVVTVDHDTQKVIAIRRNWREGDKKKRKRVYYTHYKFLPGLGFYGYGFVHAIGGLAEAATGTLRSLLDAAGFANTKGGYRSRDAKVKGGDVPIGMGEWREVDSTAEELAQAFFPLPYDEPSQTLFALLGSLDEMGRRFASTTENMIGEADNNGPVGTTLALIEQGSKVFSAIHLRLHHSHEHEFKILAELNGEYLDGEYPYRVPGADMVISNKDFDDRVDVIPVSDPNTISDTQRISRAQGTLQLSENSPDLYDKRVVHRDMLRAMRVPNVDEVMPPVEEVPPMDPVTEMGEIIKGAPVQAYLDQDHQAHMAVHEAIFNSLSEDEQKAIGPAYFAHLAEHKAFDIKLHFEELIGAQITPENQQQATQAAALVAQIYQEEAAMEGNLSGEEMQAKAEEKRKNAETMAKIKRDDLAAAADIKRKDDQAEAEIERQAGREINQAIQQGANALGLTEKAEEGKLNE
jgi:hypothetical protein